MNREILMDDKILKVFHQKLDDGEFVHLANPEMGDIPIEDLGPFDQWGFPQIWNVRVLPDGRFISMVFNDNMSFEPFPDFPNEPVWIEHHPNEEGEVIALINDEDEAHMLYLLSLGVEEEREGRENFGKRTVRKTSKKLKEQAKRLKIRVTFTRNGKRYPKSADSLRKQIKTKLKKNNR